jgi:hypothetical protein
MLINNWWESVQGERYWLETTDRDDMGSDLHTPQRDDGGNEHHSYSQILLIRAGDVVFHYDKHRRAITSYSRASGEVYDGRFVWGSHAALAREMGRGQYLRDGWHMQLDGPTQLVSPLSLAAIRERETEIRDVRLALIESVSGSIYFPFEVSDKRPPRPTQFYLTKFPSALIGVFPELGVVIRPRDSLVAAQNPRGRRRSTRQPNIELRQAVEVAAQTAVEELYREQGYSVEDVSHLNRGWDVEATQGLLTLRVEVKGRSGETVDAELTPNEYRRMAANDPTFRLCVVTDALDPTALRVHEFAWVPASAAWVTSDGERLIVDVVESARVHA